MNIHIPGSSTTPTSPHFKNYFADPIMFSMYDKMDICMQQQPQPQLICGTAEVGCLPKVSLHSSKLSIPSY